MNKLEIYTDGGCRNKIGAYSIVVYLNNKLVEKKVWIDLNTTNQRMEMKAMARALEYSLYILNPSNYISNRIDKLSIITDSQYVRKGLGEWIVGWKESGWINSQRKPVKNKDLWLILDDLNNKVEKKYNTTHIIDWTRGHDDCEGNNLADQICTDAILNYIKNNKSPILY